MEGPWRDPRDFNRSSVQDLRRRLMRGRFLNRSVSLADMMRLVHYPNSRRLGCPLYAARRIAKQSALIAARNSDARKVARLLLTTKDTNHTNHTKKTALVTFVSFVYFVVHILIHVTLDWLSLRAVDTILCDADGDGRSSATAQN
jgi:hypothetical protein